MHRTNQQDLFSSENTQTDLFGAPAPTGYIPDPVHVRNRLQALLNDMKGSEVWPWDAAIVQLHRERTFDYLCGLLPASEAVDWRATVEAEIERLDATAVAAE